MVSVIQHLQNLYVVAADEQWLMEITALRAGVRELVSAPDLAVPYPHVASLLPEHLAIEARIEQEGGGFYDVRRAEIGTQPAVPDGAPRVGVALWDGPTSASSIRGRTNWVTLVDASGKRPQSVPLGEICPHDRPRRAAPRRRPRPGRRRRRRARCRHCAAAAAADHSHSSSPPPRSRRRSTTKRTTAGASATRRRARDRVSAMRGGTRGRADAIAP